MAHLRPADGRMAKAVLKQDVGPVLQTNSAKKNANKPKTINYGSNSKVIYSTIELLNSSISACVTNQHR